MLPRGTSEVRSIESQILLCRAITSLGFIFLRVGANTEESAKGNDALAAVFPMMIVCMLVVIIFQVRSLPALAMTVLTAPLGVVGVVPILLIFRQPFGFDAILGLIALAGILMRNTLILVGQIKTNRDEGLDTFHAVVEATVQRSRPVVLTALAAVLAFIPLTSSAFWGSLAYTLIGGTAVGTVLTLVFLPALYSIWFRVKPTESRERDNAGSGVGEAADESDFEAKPQQA